MPIEALFVLFALALICAVTFGYCLRALMEGAYSEAERNSELWMRTQVGTPIPSGDVDDRLKDFSPEYGGPTKW